MKRISLPFLLIAIIAAGAFAQSQNPDSARIVTEDIERFWQAFDQAAPDFAPEIFENHYLSQCTIGLEDFTRLRIESAEKLAKTVQTHPKYYASIRASTRRIVEMKPAIRAAFYALEYLYPEAVFPDVYFLIGRMTSGGTTSERALLIGAEMYGKTPEMPSEELGDWHKQVLKPVENVPYIVAHELIHYQQKYPDAPATLLSQSIKEGVADFACELISGNYINTHVYAYANPKEQELWHEFQKKMAGTDFSGWLYNGNDAGERPADLGYWMGYKIAEAYYAKPANKRQAIKEILEIDDFAVFLQKSGYAGKFEK